MDILYVRRRYFGSSLSCRLYHLYRDFYRYYRPTGYYFRFKGLEGFFRASVHREANVTARTYGFLQKNPSYITDHFDALIFDSVKEETDDFYRYDLSELDVLTPLNDIPKILLVATDRAKEIPGDQFLNKFDLVYKREPFEDRSRYDLTRNNREKIRPTMLACPLFEPTKWNLDDLTPEDVGASKPSTDFEHDVFFSGNNTSLLREEVVDRLVGSTIDFHGGLQYRDCPPRLDSKHEFPKLSDHRYRQSLRTAKISLALDGHGEFTFRHLENWFLSTFMICSDSIENLELPINAEEGTHYVSFSTIDELLETIEYYLHHDDERRTIAQKGRELVEREYDLSHHGQQITSAIQSVS